MKAFLLLALVAAGIYLFQEGYIQIGKPKEPQAPTAPAPAAMPLEQKASTAPTPEVAPTTMPQVDLAPEPTQVEKPPRLAPPGFVFLLKYISVQTDSGVHGMLPGTKLKVLGEKDEKIQISDGQQEAWVNPEDITVDQDLAEMARSRDQSQQLKLTSVLLKQKQEHQKMAQELAAKQEEARVRGEQQRVAVNTTAQPERTPNPLDRGNYNFQRVVVPRSWRYYGGPYYDSSGRYFVDYYGRRYYQ